MPISDRCRLGSNKCLQNGVSHRPLALAGCTSETDGQTDRHSHRHCPTIRVAYNSLQRREAADHAAVTSRKTNQSAAGWLRLYSWTFNFRKVVRQQIGDRVADFIVAASAVFISEYKWMNESTNYWKRSTNAKVITKILPAFFWLTAYKLQVSGVLFIVKFHN